MNVFNGLFSVIFTVVITLTFSPTIHAEEDRNDYINGLASYSKLYREQFVAALFLTEKSTDENVILESTDYKRMVMLITALKLSARTFASEWGAAIELNNNGSEEYQRTSLKDGGLEEFLSLPRTVSDGKLSPNDYIEIELVRSKKSGHINTVVKVNGELAFAKKGRDLFQVLLRSWIGENPPTADFKDQLLGKKQLRNHEEVVAHVKSMDAKNS